MGNLRRSEFYFHHHILNLCVVIISLSSITRTNASDEVRLINTFDGSVHKGRVEVRYAEAWGTICDTSWDIVDADVVCRQLGYTGALRALDQAYFGSGDNVIWMDRVQCTGDEERIQDCPQMGWGQHSCSHRDDASVECSSATVRLVEGPNRFEGHVQVLHEGTWGYVCDDDWSMENGAVVCDQLAGKPADGISIRSYYGDTSDGKFWLNEVQCTGDEGSIETCPHSGWGNTSGCTGNSKAGVRCNQGTKEDGAVRLFGSSSPNRGTVEIYHNGEWGTVCDDGWDYYDAKVVCRQLGYTDAQPKAYYRSYYASGSGRIWKDEVLCYGSETRLENCLSLDWGTHNCDHSEDAGVYCDVRGEFDGAEIAGIILGSILGFMILCCCIKYVLTEAQNSKQNRRSGRRHRRGNGTTTSRSTNRNNTPEAHFDAHFNNAFSLGDDPDSFTPQGMAYPPPFSSDPPPFTPSELPPSYEYVISVDEVRANGSGAIGSPSDAHATATNPAPVIQAGASVSVKQQAAESSPKAVAPLTKSVYPPQLSPTEASSSSATSFPVHPHAVAAASAEPSVPSEALPADCPVSNEQVEQPNTMTEVPTESNNDASTTSLPVSTAAESKPDPASSTGGGNDGDDTSEA
ncbi:neurotrypsin-like [Diadema setosum]|uniref:neurotrypsin-like n=1 Tax=Diadema setosum TaxID=31175 RepID=UPI003B3BB662